MRHLDIGYSDVLSMPVYERKFFLTTFVQEKEKQATAYENQNSSTGNEKGRRVSKVGGEQLKSKLKSGEIPNF